MLYARCVTVIRKLLCLLRFLRRLVICNSRNSIPYKPRRRFPNAHPAKQNIDKQAHYPGGSHTTQMTFQKPLLLLPPTALCEELTLPELVAMSAPVPLTPMFKDALRGDGVYKPSCPSTQARILSPSYPSLAAKCCRAYSTPKVNASGRFKP